MPDWDAMAVVGRVARPHGIRGQVIVNPETDFPEERFHPGAELFVNRAGRAEPITITTVRFQQQRPVIGLRGAFTIARLASKSATPPCTSRLHFPVTIAGSCGSPATEPIEPAAEKVSDWNV
jgi:hypothetical protein